MSSGAFDAKERVREATDIVELIGAAHELRRQGSVAGHRRPAVPQYDCVVGPDVHHRLDGEEHPLFEHHPAATQRLGFSVSHNTRPPRKGEIDWVTWVERIPSNFETRYYIMRVLGNAVTYSHMYPDEAGLPRPIDAFLP